MVNVYIPSFACNKVMFLDDKMQYVGEPPTKLCKQGSDSLLAFVDYMLSVPLDSAVIKDNQGEIIAVYDPCLGKKCLSSKFKIKNGQIWTLIKDYTDPHDLRDRMPYAFHSDIFDTTFKHINPDEYAYVVSLKGDVYALMDAFRKRDINFHYGHPAYDYL